MDATRSEEITINIDLDYEKYQVVADLVKQISGRAISMRAGDNLEFNYTFGIDYFGSVEKNLGLVLVILNLAEGAVVSVDSELIDGASCLIARVVEKLGQIQTKLKEK